MPTAIPIRAWRRRICIATDAPDSPHLLAPKMKARVYVAGAVEDPSFPDDMKKRLDDALSSA